MKIPELGTSTTLREQLILLVLAETGMRPSTLTRLTYGMIKEDLEKRKILLAIRIPSEITKAKIEYVTFL